MGGIIDTDMDISQAHITAVGLTHAVSADAVAYAVESPYRLDVQMDQLARMFAHVVQPWLDWFEVQKPIQANPAVHLMHGGR